MSGGASGSQGSSAAEAGDKMENEEEEDWEYYDDSTVLTVFWQIFVDEERDFTKPVPVWLRHFVKPFENSYGWNMYREFWRVWVPLLLAPRNGTTSVDTLSEQEERKMKAVLIDSLEQFICGGEDVAGVFKSLAEADAPPAVCGHVFKPGETCYNCRDCGQDATCVLCVQCFTKSEHKQHRYRMSTSDGGGYCDCGDSEAWTSAPCCALHTPGGAKVDRSPSEVLAAMPPDLVARAKDVIYNVVRYAFDVVTEPNKLEDLVSATKEKELFPDLKFPLQYSNYCCVLLNDESHSYEEVTRVLEKVLPKPTPALARDLTTYVDKAGKAVVRVGNYKECCTVSGNIEARTRIASRSVLKSKVVQSYIVAHQAFVTRLLEWLPSLLRVSSGFRAIFQQVLYMDHPATNVKLKRSECTCEALACRRPDMHPEHKNGLHPLAEAFLLNDINSWKRVRSLWLTLIIEGLMKDYESKKQLASLFTKNYPSIMHSFVTDDQEKDSSITCLSVQIFTVPSLTIHLMEHCDALSGMLQGFLNLLQEHQEEDGQLVLEHEERGEFERGLSSLYDLTYLLNVVPSAEQWTDGLRRNFQAGVTKVLEILWMMQGMDGMKRQVGQHVELEDSMWKLTYELQSYLGDILRLVVNWAVSDATVLKHVIHATLKCITDKNKTWPEVKEASKHLAFLGAPRVFTVLDYDVAKETVSLHAPLHRLLVNLLVDLPRHDSNSVTTCRKRIEDMLPLPRLVEPVLQVSAVVAQINIGMWRRNGSQAENQAFLYTHKKYCPGVREADLLLLQLTAALTDDVETFLVSLLARFKLTKWATGDLDSEAAVRADEFVEHCNGLAEQWLGLCVAMAGERVVPGVGEGITAALALRREAIQVLCVEPLSHSNMVKRLPERKDLEKEVETVVGEVAELKSAGQGAKLYHLRPGLEAEYCLFYPGHTREQQTAAQEAQLAKTAPCPPPPLPPLTKLFSGLVRLLQSEVMLQAIAVTLRRAADTSSGRSRYVTEGQIHKAVYLLALGVREAASESRSSWLERARSAGLVELAQGVADCAALPQHVRGLAVWVVRGCRGEEAVPMEVDPPPGDSKEEATRKAKAKEAAAARRAKILAQMNKAQKTFAADNSVALAGMEDGAKQEVTRQDSLVAAAVCLGPGQTKRGTSASTYTCILCQEEGSVGATGAALVMAAYIQKTTVLSQAAGWEGPQPVVAPHHLFVDRECGPHLSTCGHAMHAPCYQKFFDSLVQKERHNAINLLGKIQNFDVSVGEFTCPICERLSNTVLPLIPSVSQLRAKQSSAPSPEIGLKVFIEGLTSTAESWHLREDKDEGPALSRMALRTSLEEQAALHGRIFAQCFQTTLETDCFPLEEGLTGMMNAFSLAAFTTSLELNPFEEDYRVPLVTLQTAALTLATLERTLWLEGRPLLGSLNPRDEDAVRYMVRFVAAFPSSYSKPPGSANMRDLLRKMKNFYKLKSLQNNAAFLLACILCENKPDDVDPLSLDCLGVLVSLVVSLPCLFNSDLPPRLPTGQGMELHCLKLVLLLHTVQLLHSFTDFAPFIRRLPPALASSGQDGLQKMVAAAAGRQGVAVQPGRLNSEALYSRLEELLLPFMRCAVLFFQHFTDVAPGQDLVEEGGRSYPPLARYLGLPCSLAQLVDSPACSSLLARLLARSSANPLHPVVLPATPAGFRHSLPPLALGHPQARPYFPLASLAHQPGAQAGGLIHLPRDYTDLMNLAAAFTCPNSTGGPSLGEVKSPALCLICGMMVCSQSACCETVINGDKCGGCVSHARQCGADTGLFLRIRECLVVLHSKVTRGTFLAAPYLDMYGEADKGLKRGNPLYLDGEKYEEINKIWLRNEVPVKIARMYDPDLLVLVNWHKL